MGSSHADRERRRTGRSPLGPPRFSLRPKRLMRYTATIITRITGLRMPTQMATVVATHAIPASARTAPLAVEPRSQPHTSRPSDSVTRTEKEPEPETCPASLVAVTVRVAV